VYDDSHLARLRLVRALLDVGGLSVVAAREVLGALDSRDLFESLGTVQSVLPPEVPDDVDTAPAAAAVAALGWDVDDCGRPARQLAHALAALQAVGRPITDPQLQAYGAAAALVAEQDIAAMPQESSADALSYAVVGTVLYEPVLLALRRLAHQNVSARVLGNVTD
jgi:hypothetical protein